MGREYRKTPVKLAPLCKGDEQCHDARDCRCDSQTATVDDTIQDHFIEVHRMRDIDARRP